MTQDPCLIPTHNPSQVYLDLEVLRLFDERPSCPLYWDKDAEFIIDPRDIMDMYSINNETYPPGVAWNLSKLCGRPVLFKRVDKTTLQIPGNRASAPGYFHMFVEDESGEWVTPYPEWKQFDFAKL